MQFLTIIDVNEGAHLLTHLATSLASCHREKSDERFNLPMDDFLVFLLTFEHQFVDVLEVLHIVEERFEIEGDVFFQGTQGLYIAVLQGLFRDRNHGTDLLHFHNFLKKIDLDPPKDKIHHAQTHHLKFLLHLLP